jgi:hypothetical protein
MSFNASIISLQTNVDSIFHSCLNFCFPTSRIIDKSATTSVISAHPEHSIDDVLYQHSLSGAKSIRPLSLARFQK